MYKCVENGSVVAVEPDCSTVPTPLCEREGEYVLDVLEEGHCCPKKICGEVNIFCRRIKHLKCKPLEMPLIFFLVVKYAATVVFYSLHVFILFYLECNMTICDSEAPSCDNGNKLVIGYSALSCCPEYRCGKNKVI